MSDAENFPAWNADKPKESLDSIYHWAIAKAEAQIAWYQIKRAPKRSGSQWIRAISVSAVVIGALCPLIDAALASVFPTKLSQWGYVLLAIAAGLFSYDKYFGLSTGWIRYVQTEWALRKTLTEFRYSWLSAITQWPADEPAAGDVLKQIQLAKEFSIQIETLEKQETDAWVTEFQSNLADLEKAVKTTKESIKPGSVSVKVANAQKFESVAIRLNDSPVKVLKGVGECFFENVPPGHCVVSVTATKEGKSYWDNRIVEVTSGVSTAVEFTIQSGGT